jgi:YggT family protein
VLYRLTEPALKPIRRVVPTVGGLDLSPVVLLLLLILIRNLLFWYVF